MYKMQRIEVAPREGIGSLKLGMSPQEILAGLEEMRGKWNSVHEQQISCSTEEADGEIVRRYMDGASFFMVSYQDDRAVEIAVDNDIRSQRVVELLGLDVFRLPAEELVSELKKRSMCCCDAQDERFGTNFEFPDIGNRLWREEAFHPSMLEDEAYVCLMGDALPEMQQYRYFQMVAVR